MGVPSLLGYVGVESESGQAVCGPLDMFAGTEVILRPTVGKAQVQGVRLNQALFVRKVPPAMLGDRTGL